MSFGITDNMEKFKTNKVPICKDGEVAWFPSYLHKDDYEWIENKHFNAWLSPKETIKHGRQLKFVFESHDKTKQYEMFPEDALEVMKHMNNGAIAGMFEYICRGGYYGIKLIHASS